MDPLDDVAQPRCPECRTVLRSAPTGFTCATCRLAFLPSMPSPNDEKPPTTSMRGSRGLESQT